MCGIIKMKLLGEHPKVKPLKFFLIDATELHLTNDIPTRVVREHHDLVAHQKGIINST